MIFTSPATVLSEGPLCFIGFLHGFHPEPNNPVDRREEAVNPPPYCEAVLPPTAPSEGGSSSAPAEHVAVPMELQQQAEHRGGAGAGDGVGNHSSWALAPGSS